MEGVLTRDQGEVKVVHGNGFWGQRTAAPILPEFEPFAIAKPSPCCRIEAQSLWGFRNVMQCRFGVRGSEWQEERQAKAMRGS